jgi:hypothetical protein
VRHRYGYRLRPKSVERPQALAIDLWDLVRGEREALTGE